MRKTEYDMLPPPVLRIKVGDILAMTTMKKSLCLICVICIICMTFLCTEALAESQGEFQETPVVTLVWGDRRVDVRAAEWNERSVLIRTEDVGLGNGKIYDYSGVKLSDLMILAGADVCTKALVKSEDGMTVEVSAEDIRNYDIALINSYADGKPLKADAGGPLKLVFPITEYPELKDTYATRSWQWYVCEVEFVRHSPDAVSGDSVQEPVGVLSGELVRRPTELSPVESVWQLGEASSGESVSSENLGHVDKCVIIVLDGFSSRYITQLGSNSSLARISETGACCLTARSTYPAHTCTNHVTIMTGVGAARHGIVGNDRLGEDGVSSVKNIQPDMIRVPTLFQIASAARKKTAFVSGKDDLVTLLSESLDLGVSNKRPKEYLPAAPELTDSSDNDEYYRYNMDLADWVFESLFTVLETEEPDLTMVNIQSTDYIAHRFGPGSKEMTACLRSVDEQLDELYRKMENAGMLEDTAVIITADHGMTPADKAIPLTTLTYMNFPTAGAVIDGRNGYIWYGKEDRETVIRFFENVEGVRNAFERKSDQARDLNVDYPGGPDLFLEAKPGYVFLPEQMLDLYHGQHGSRDDSDMIVPIICFGAGIPSGVGIEPSDLRSIAPVVCQLMGLPSGDFDLGTPALLEGQDRTILNP